MKNKGFTLIELMVVILIVAVLAALVGGMLKGRIDAAKWSEGKAMMGNIGSSVKAYYAEKGEDYILVNGVPSMTDLYPNTGVGVASTDLDGTHFTIGDFAITTLVDENNFSITCTSKATGTAPKAPAAVVMTCASGVTTFDN